MIVVQPLAVSRTNGEHPRAQDISYDLSQNAEKRTGGNTADDSTIFLLCNSTIHNLRATDACRGVASVYYKICFGNDSGIVGLRVVCEDQYAVIII